LLGSLLLLLWLLLLLLRWLVHTGLLHGLGGGGGGRAARGDARHRVLGRLVLVHAGYRLLRLLLLLLLLLL